jgi:Subtilase family
VKVRFPLSNSRLTARFACQFASALACAAVTLAVSPADVSAATPGASGGESTASPLPAGEYETQRACAIPLPGRPSCMASVLVASSPAARAHLHPLGLAAVRQPDAPTPDEGDFGLRPQDLHAAYSLPTTAGSAQTIALVDAYNDPAAEADLRTYDEEFSLPACTSENGCFRQVNQRGETTNLPFPKSVGELTSARGGDRAEQEAAEEATGWGVEISLDIETAHAVCQSCHIILAEATVPINGDLESAERAAESLGANEISNSWGGPEEGITAEAEAEGPFDHPGTVITASAGDDGYLDWDTSPSGSVEFPAASPHVVAVGGTRLKLGAASTWAGETVWNGDGAGGGGCSTVFPAPAWQLSLSDWSSVGCGSTRAVADVSADADPYTGVAVADSTSPKCETSYTEGKTKHVLHWCTLGGTSLASPIIASVFALAGGAAGVSYPASTVYAKALATPNALHDVTSGSNGECDQPFNTSTGVSGCTVEQESAQCVRHLICLAGSGYDGPSGLGTPDGISAFAPGGEEAPDSQQPAGGSQSGDSSPGPGSGEAPAGSQPDPGEDEGEEGQTPSPETGTISGLSLTPGSWAAAAHHRVLQLAFAFSATASVHVRVTLSRSVAAHGRVHWHALRRSETIVARKGRNSARLWTGPLAPGTYRLTLTTNHGQARSVVIHVRG